MKRILLIILLFVTSLWSTCAYPVLLYGDHYYTHVTKDYTWDEANNYAMSLGGYLAIPNDIEENNWFVAQGWREDWLGIYDPNKIENFCTTGASTCIPDDSRFRTVKGDAVLYKNWEDYEPNNLVLPEDFDENGDPLVTPLGEYWVLLGTSGKWGDYGNHANSYQSIFRTSSIIEFDTAPACHGEESTEEIVVPDVFCIADYNGDDVGQEEEIFECTPSTTGSVCDADMEMCDPKYIDANCTSDGVLETDRNMCQLDGSIACPAEYTFDELSDLCYQDVVRAVPDMCPNDNYVFWQDDLCIDEPVCPVGTTYDTTRNRCEAPVVCPTGTLYNSVTGFCEERFPASADCSLTIQGTVFESIPAPDGTSIVGIDTLISNQIQDTVFWFDSGCVVKAYATFPVAVVSGFPDAEPGTSFDVIFTGPVENTSTMCNSGDIYTGSDCLRQVSPSCSVTAPYQDGDTCYNSASCLDGGTLDDAVDQCVLPTEPAFNEEEVDCGVGTLDVNTSRCIIPDTVNEDTCPEGYSYSPYPVSKCEAIPLCEQGTYIPAPDALPKPYNNTVDHLITDMCYLGDVACPHGDQFDCMTVPTLDYLNYCSPWSCTDASGITYSGSVVGSSDKTNDAVIDENGCAGQIYIFNGKDYRCRSEDAFFGLTGGGCCDEDKVFLNLVTCKEDEKILAVKNRNDLCHYVGEYCSKELDLVLTTICIQKTQTYCCFNSVLGRIMQEQARPQLNIAWGSPESPQCRGFKPEEFEKIDFSQLDLSEFEESLSYPGGETDTTSSFYDDTKESITSKTEGIVQ